MDSKPNHRAASCVRVSTDLELSRVLYWTKGESCKNFGDYLTELFLDALFTHPKIDAARYRLIGSTIDDWIINDDLKDAREPAPRVAFWCCGKRDEHPLPEQALERAAFFGVRGPLTRDALGLPIHTPMGDPAFLLPILYASKPAGTVGHAICVPHILDPGEKLLERSGADLLLRPGVADLEGLLDLIDRIAAADFVLAGSLHAAIVACAYGRPFGFWDSGHIDVPFKWHDFAASIGIEPIFAPNVIEAKTIYQSFFKKQLRHPALSRLLRCAPFEVQPRIRWRAAIHDSKRLLRRMGLIR